MTHTPDGNSRLARLLFAELAEELDRALEASGGSPEADRARAVDRLLDERAASARSGELGKAAFAGVSEPEADRFDGAFAAARTVVAWAGLDLPEPESFWAAGAQRSQLARALMADATLVPVPAPYGLGVDRWNELFRAAARQSGSPLSLAAPLVLAPEVVTEFSLLDAVPRGVAQLDSQADDRTHSAPAVRWTLRLIPAAQKPPLVGLSHNHGPHPSLPEILMLQLMRIAAGEDLVDANSFTWVHGTLGGGRFAARELFDATDRSVRVNAREIGNQGPHLGARPPIG